MQETGFEEQDRRSRGAGCLTAVGVMLLIGVPLFLLNALGECLPRDGSAEMEACDFQKSAVWLFCLFGLPIIALLVGWAVARAGYRRARRASDRATPK
jgi:hypothetical protein